MTNSFHEAVKLQCSSQIIPLLHLLYIVQVEQKGLYPDPLTVTQQRQVKAVRTGLQSISILQQVFNGQYCLSGQNN